MAETCRRSDKFIRYIYVYLLVYHRMQKIFVFSNEFGLVLRPTQTRVPWLTWDLSAGVKGTVHEIDQLSLSCVEVNIWIYTPTAYLPSWHVETLLYILFSLA